jgi:probable HAF family extracellular repeat protein
LAVPPGAYQFTELGTLGAPNSPTYGTWPHAVNNAGQVAGRGRTPTRDYTPFRWANGVMTQLANAYGDAEGMNNAGQVVGAVQSTGGAQSAFVWTDGMLQTLPSSGWYEGAAKAISNGGLNGVIVTGFVRLTSGSTATAALWQNGALTTIPNMNIAFGVNDQGKVVGDFRDPSGTTNAVRYDSGVTSTVWANGGARDVNDAGQIVGWRSTNGLVSSVIYDNGVLTDIVSGGSVNLALSINEGGAVVGRYQSSTNGEHGYLWQDGQFYDLNDIASAGAGNVFATAEGINDQGQIVGLYRTSSGIYGGYLLTPIPEPAGVGGMAIGVASLMRRRGRLGGVQRRRWQVSGAWVLRRPPSPTPPFHLGCAD